MSQHGTRRTPNYTEAVEKKIIMKNWFRAKNIPDDYHILDRAGPVILICLCSGHNRLNSHTQYHHHYIPVEQKNKQQNTCCKVVQQVWSDGTSLHHKLYRK